jgi:serine/threonine protein kinase
MLQQGSVIGARYEIVDLLGGGGMKQVWLARDRRLGGRTCALAEMIDSFRTPTARIAAEAAFKREAELLASLSNEHIPRVYDSFSEGSAHYLVMEHMRGKTLDATLKSAGRLSEQVARNVALQIAETLQYLHSCNPAVIYRDLKPSNVILEPSGHVILLDFGIARHFQAPATVTMVGTPGYAAPEQWKGRAEPRSDVYALGALLHQLLSGRDPTLEPPFSFPPLQDLCPACTREIATLVNDSLKYDLNDRISSIAVFRKRLIEAEKAATTGSAGVRASLAPTVQISQRLAASRATLRWLRRNSSSAMVSAAVGALIGLALWNNLGSKPSAPESSPEPSAISSPELSRPRPEESPVAASSPSSSKIHVRRLVAKTPPRRDSDAYRHEPAAVIASVPKPIARAMGTLGASRPLSKDLEDARLGGYFTIGSTKDDVLAIQGTPDRFTNNSFHYGLSSVHFDQNGRVTSWENSAFKELKVRMVPGVAYRSRYFTIGSRKDDVLAVQGTPDRFTETSFHYGLSSVYFDAAGRVTGWENSAFKELKVRMLPRVATASSYFTIGSTKDEVLAIQGTPDRFTDSSFHYGLSSVFFDADGRVTSWENSAFKELKVRMVPQRAYGEGEDP